MSENFDAIVVAWGLPHPDNRVGYDRNGRVVLTLKQANWEAHKRLRRKLKHLVGHMGCHHLLPRHLYLGKRIPIGGTGHQCGTVRFGTDPTSSALDTTCKAHRGGQPLRRRWRLLCLCRCGEPRPDDHRKRPAGRRPAERQASLIILRARRPAPLC